MFLLGNRIVIVSYALAVVQTYFADGLRLTRKGGDDMVKNVNDDVLVNKNVKKPQTSVNERYEEMLRELRAEKKRKDGERGSSKDSSNGVSEKSNQSNQSLIESFLHQAVSSDNDTNNDHDSTQDTFLAPLSTEELADIEERAKSELRAEQEKGKGGRSRENPEEEVAEKIAAEEEFLDELEKEAEGKLRPFKQFLGVREEGDDDGDEKNTSGISPKDIGKEVSPKDIGNFSSVFGQTPLSDIFDEDDSAALAELKRDQREVYQKWSDTTYTMYWKKPKTSSGQSGQQASSTSFSQSSEKNTQEDTADAEKTETSETSETSAEEAPAGPETIQSSLSYSDAWARISVDFKKNWLDLGEKKQNALKAGCLKFVKRQFTEGNSKKPSLCAPENNIDCVAITHRDTPYAGSVVFPLRANYRVSPQRRQLYAVYLRRKAIRDHVLRRKKELEQEEKDRKNGKKQKKGLTSGEIVGIVLGSIVFVAVLLALYLFCRNTQEKEQEKEEERKLLPELFHENGDRIPTVTDEQRAFYDLEEYGCEECGDVAGGNINYPLRIPQQEYHNGGQPSSTDTNSSTNRTLPSNPTTLKSS